MTSTAHPVWEILDKDKYVEDFYPKAEAMYDFIKSIVTTCGNTTKDGNTVPTMKVFFDMWNEFSSETFWILDRLVNTEGRESKSCTDFDDTNGGNGKRNCTRITESASFTNS